MIMISWKQKIREIRKLTCVESVPHGRSALHVGVIKTASDGSSIKPWEDPWIPTNPTRKPLCRKPDGTISRVEELIDEESGAWNMDMVKANFEQPLV